MSTQGSRYTSNHPHQTEFLFRPGTHAATSSLAKPSQFRWILLLVWHHRDPNKLGGIPDQGKKPLRLATEWCVALHERTNPDLEVTSRLHGVLGARKYSWRINTTALALRGLMC